MQGQTCGSGGDGKNDDAGVYHDGIEERHWQSFDRQTLWRFASCRVVILDETPTNADRGLGRNAHITAVLANTGLGAEQGSYRLPD